MVATAPTSVAESIPSSEGVALATFSPGGSISDRELLKRFLAGDQSAFAALVRRHATLVMGACRRVLPSGSDADDAFQATFFVLARKARGLDWRDSIAGWLYQTARRSALKLRATTARRRAIEQRAGVRDEAAASVDPSRPATLRELTEILDQELAALPDPLREAILLSQVEGLSRDEAAERLGVSSAAVKDRLERGRERLRARLLRRGVTLSAATLAAWLTPGASQAASLSALSASTAQAAGAFAAGSFASGSLVVGTTSTAAALAHGVLNMMGFEKLRFLAACLLSLLTAGGVAYGLLRDDPTRFEQGLRGEIVAVGSGSATTVTVELHEFGALLSLDVAPTAEVRVAYEAATLADLKPGQYVSLRLADDHRTVNQIHVQGTTREASIKSIDPSGKITVIEGDEEDEDAVSREVALAPDAILRIGGLPATREDLKPGMSVPLEFGRDETLVNAIEADAEENAIVEGEFIEVSATKDTVYLALEDDETGEPRSKPLRVAADVLVTLDGKPAKLGDVKPKSPVRVRLTDDGLGVRAMQATTPEPDDEEEQRPEAA